MPQRSKTLPSCPSKLDLELYRLDSRLSSSERLRLQRHLATCSGCRRTLRALNRFYTLLSRERRQPVANAVLDMAKALAPHSVRFGLLIGTPAPELDQKYGKAYRTHLVFSANGDAGRRRLDDYNLHNIARNQIALRVFTDPPYQEMAVYLWRHSDDDAQRLCLRWSGRMKTLLLSPNGASAMALTDLSKLDNQVFYLIQAKNLPNAPAAKLPLQCKKNR
jgi:hypothetical protein